MLPESLSDGRVIVYLQDILVLPEYQRRGIGRELMSVLMAEYPSIRQRVLMTDAEQAQRDFYEAMGFTEVHDEVPPLRVFFQFS